MPYKQMSIITRKWGNQKPSSGSQINWGHPLSQGLVGAWLMNEGRGKKYINLVNSKPATILGTVGWGIRTKGYVFTHANTVNNGLKFEYIPNGNTTIFAIARRTSDTLTAPAEINVLSATKEGGSRPGILLGMSNTWAAAGSKYKISAECQSTAPANTGLNLYVDGKQQVSWSSSDNQLTVNVFYSIAFTGVPGVNQYNLHQLGCSHYDTFNTFAGYVEVAVYYTWNRVLSPSEIQQLYVSPYQFIRPITRRVFFIPPTVSAVARGRIARVQRIARIQRITI